jgi:hypothetical protein
MAKKTFDTRPADGGSYRKTKDGKFERISPEQKPDPGKTARRKAAEQAAKQAETATKSTTGSKAGSKE